jgi:hypothetical protein
MVYSIISVQHPGERQAWISTDDFQKGINLGFQTHFSMEIDRIGRMFRCVWEMIRMNGVEWRQRRLIDQSLLLGVDVWVKGSILVHDGRTLTHV